MTTSAAVPSPSAAGAPPTSPARALAQTLLGSQVQQAVYVAARLELADHLRDGPCTADELASVVNAHPWTLYRFMRALTGMGILVEDERHRFALTALGSTLSSDAPDSVRCFALWSGGVSYQAFGGLEQSVRTGSPAFESLYGMDFFDYLASHPEQGAIFDQMMARHTGPVAPSIAGYPLPEGCTVVEVGGGLGHLLAAVLRAHPDTRGVLVEHPRLVERARRAIEAAGLADRCSVQGADILHAVAPGDVYLVKSVVHGLADADAARVLGNCRRAMRGNGTVLLVELVVPPGNDPHPGKLMDLLMLVGCHGRERTEEEFRTLLAAAGLRLARVLPTRYGYGILEAVPA